MKQNLYEDLKRMILTMELAPGASLDETRLSEEYKMSRTPLRDVFRRLEGEGYLEIINNKGASVSSMDHGTLRSFFLAAPMIYAAIGRLAVLNAIDQQLWELKAVQRKFIRAVEQRDADGMIFQNDSFHRKVGEMAGNLYLTPSYERLLIDHGRISQTFYRPESDHGEEDLKTTAEHHDEMIQSILDRDPDAMALLTGVHWQLSKNHMESYIRPDPLPFETEYIA